MSTGDTAVEAFDHPVGPGKFGHDQAVVDAVMSARLIDGGGQGLQHYHN